MADKDSWVYVLTNKAKILDHRTTNQMGGRAKPKEVKQTIKKTVSSKEASELIKELVEKGVLQEVLEGKEKFIELVNK